MRILRPEAAYTGTIWNAVLAVGNFDGVHRGHQAVIGVAQAIARTLGVATGVVTFEPHPRSVLRPGGPPFRLTPARSKLRYLARLGIDFVVAIRFTPVFHTMGPEEFVGQVLSGRLRGRHITVGSDFRFGRDRSAGITLLAAEAARYGVGVTAVGTLTDSRGEVLSSTGVRAALTAGRPEAAAEILGRPFEIEGRVMAGNRLGRRIGFPTANIALRGYQRPAFGVYAVRVGICDDGAVPADGGVPDPAAGTAGGRGLAWGGGPDVLRWHPGVANLGRRPTIGGTSERLEVHLFDWSGDLYGRRLRVELISYLREERRFEGIEALSSQIARDAEAARRILASPPCSVCEWQPPDR